MISGPPPYAPESGQPVQAEEIQMTTAPQTAAGKRALVTFSIKIFALGYTCRYIRVGSPSARLAPTIVGRLTPIPHSTN